jgi:hypothetical protein
MPRRKRIDPVDAPIDGDYRLDHVDGKDPSKHYAYIHPDDLGTARSRGMVKTERVEGGPSSPGDIHTEGDIRVGDLVLMEMPKERHDAIQRRSERAHAERQAGNDAAIRAHIAANGGAGPTNKYEVRTTSN